MQENPYEPPRSIGDDQLNLSEVTVHSRLPLHLSAQRHFQVDPGAGTLADCVQRAAKACSFSIVKRDDALLLLRRGSQWHALYTFDIRKVPTLATVSLRPPHEIHVEFRCRSVWQFSTRGDARRLLRELMRFETECRAGGESGM